MPRLVRVLLLVFWITPTCLAAEPTEVKSLDELEWLVGVTEGSTKLPEDVEDYGRKGDEVTLRVTTERGLNGKFLIARAEFVKNGKSRHVFTEMWGMHPSHDGIHKWSFDAGGVVLDGKVMWEGDDQVVHWIEGTTIPKGNGLLEELAKKLKLERLPYSGEVVFRRIDTETVGVTVRSAKVAGAPVPWPNLGVEEIHRRVK